MVALPIPVDDPGEEFVHAERELADLDRAIASLSSTSTSNRHALNDLVRQRGELKSHMVAARLGVLEKRLTRIDQDYLQARAARQVSLAMLSAAATMYARAQASLTAAQSRARQLRGREEALLAHRREVLAQVELLRAIQRKSRTS